MHSSRSTATPNAVDVRSLIRLYVTTLEARRLPSIGYLGLPRCFKALSFLGRC